MKTLMPSKPQHDRRQRSNIELPSTMKLALTLFCFLLSRPPGFAFPTSVFAKHSSSLHSSCSLPRGGNVVPSVSIDANCEGNVENSDSDILFSKSASSNGNSNGAKDNHKNGSNNNKKVRGFGRMPAAIRASGGSAAAATFQQEILEDTEDTSIATNYVAETNLPTDLGHYRLRAYRIENAARDSPNPHVGNEPCVIYCTDLPPGKLGETGPRKKVPVRIHDQCFTSEVFRSQRCDCKEQLQMALGYLQEHGGAIIYLQQEGRGIGLANKVAAYALQDDGMDTVDANIHLGFPEDCRQYGVVPAMLKDMGIDSIQLMTNNPRKVKRLTALGVNVEGTIPMVVPKTNEFNRRYLEAKVERMAHTGIGVLLDEENSAIDLKTAKSAVTAKNVKVLPKASIQGINGIMAPKKLPPVITDGANSAACAVTQAILDDTTQTGVAAKDDGYCFGKKSVTDAIAAVARGELVVVVDDESRENEGDFIMASDLVTPETMATFIRYSSGVICVGMESKRLDELKLPSMTAFNEDPKETAFTVSVDASKEHGITTGISALERAKTIKVLSDPSSTFSDFNRPGHIFPLRAREGGVLERNGHTEASVDLARLAGCNPCGVLCEIVSEENPVEMARLPELKKFCKKHGFVLTSIVDIAQYRRETEGEGNDDE